MGGGVGVCMNIPRRTKKAAMLFLTRVSSGATPTARCMRRSPS